MKDMKKFFIQKISFIILITLIISSFTGCIETEDNPEMPDRGFFMGLLPIPSENQDFEEAYKQAAQYSEFVPIWSSGTGASGFWDYADKLKGWWGKTFIEGYIRGNKMFPIIQFSFIDKDQKGQLTLMKPENIKNATLNQKEWRELYKKSILDVVRAVKPLYLSTGNEVNRWFEIFGNQQDNPNGFQHYVSLHEEIYDEIKEISPETKVFCVFAREIINENREADLEIINMFNFDKLDLLIFTSYPYAIKDINHPSDIPYNYYSYASNYIPEKPFGFSELGWSSLESFGGEKGQQDFLFNVSTSLTRNQGVNLHLFGYCWLHDVDENDTTGLIKRDGTEKLGYLTWKQISESSIWREQSNEKIVFTSKADSSKGEIYLLDKNGIISRLTNNNRHENNPALSFDGKKIAFHAGEEKNPLTWEIYILNLDTMIETQLTNNHVIDGHPDWSPDGEQIVFASFVDSEGNPSATADIYLINIDGTNLVKITDSPWEDNDPEWSPDGTKITFKSTRYTQQAAREEIFVMDSNGENIKRLTNTNGWESDHDPSWLKDSKTIVYEHYEGIRPWTDIANIEIFQNNWDELIPWNIYSVDLEENQKKLTDVEHIAYLPVFSSDGEKILFIQLDFIIIGNKLIGVNHRLILINNDGNNPRQLIPDDEHTPTLEYFDW